MTNVNFEWKREKKKKNKETPSMTNRLTVATQPKRRCHDDSNDMMEGNFLL
jgi:hypothetical protein